MGWGGQESKNEAWPRLAPTQLSPSAITRHYRRHSRSFPHAFLVRVGSLLPVCR